MAKAIQRYQRFVDCFLDGLEPDPASRLIFLGQYAGQPFNAEQLRVELREKLNRLHYPQPDREHPDERPTFANVLEKAEVLSNLLSDDTLLEFWKSLLLKKIFERSRKLRDGKESGFGVSLQERRRRQLDIEKDIKTLKKIDGKYGLNITQPQYDKMIWKSMDEFIPIYLSERSGAKDALLSFTLPVPEWKTKFKRRGRRRLPKSSAHQPVSTTRIEDNRIQAFIYETLEQRLQNPRTYQNGIDDIFLCQLAELVCAPADVQGLSSGESLRRVINRLRH